MTGKRHTPGQLESLGAQLEKRRRELGLSAREVAASAGISPVYLRVIETGRNSKTGRASRPSPDVLMQVSRTLGLPANELLSLAGYEGLSAEPVDGVPLDQASPREISNAMPPVLERIAAAAELVQTRPSDFMRELLDEELARFESHLSAIAAGSLLCEPRDDRVIRRRALREACRSTLHAVSLHHPEWWLDPEITGYIDTHSELARLARPVTMLRVFLVRPEQRAAYEVLFEALVRAGVDVRVADPHDVPKLCRRDIEIYDGALLREAWGHTGEECLTEYTDDNARLQRAEASFAQVLRTSASVGRGGEVR